MSACGSVVLARGWCGKHLARFYKHGDPSILLHKTTCSAKGCDGRHVAKGFCARHFEQERRRSGYHAKAARKISTRFTDCLRYARDRNLPWTIQFEAYVSLISSNKCHYCSGPLPETKVGLDRLDNYKGYHLDNVVPCCRYCNQMKSNIYTYEEFKEFSTTELFKKVLARLHKGTK